MPIGVSILETKHWKLMIPFLGPLIEKAGNALDNLFTSDEERLKARGELQKLQNELATAILEHEKELIKAQKSIIEQEYKQGSWLARNWRPILMTVFTAMIAHRYLLLPFSDFVAEVFNLPMVILEPESMPDNVWDLLKIGLGGYIVGRSGEKIASSLGKK